MKLCNARHEDDSSIYSCTREYGHSGKHQHWNNNRAFLYKEWPQEEPKAAHPAGRAFGKTAAMPPIFVTDEDLKDAEEIRRALFGMKPNPQPTPVPLTVEDLKVIAFYLSAVDEEDGDDEQEVKAKIDRALKAAL